MWGISAALHFRVKHWNISALGVWGGLAVGLTAGTVQLRADETNTETRIRLLQEQNDALQTQVRKQQELIDSLGREVSEIRKANDKRDAAIEQIKSDGGDSYKDSTAPGASGINFGKLQITGEGGAAFFDSGTAGRYPNSF